MSNQFRRFAAGLLFCSCSFAATALEQVEGVSVDGFLTTAFGYADESDASYLNQLVTDDVRADTRDTRLGLQVSAEVDRKLDMTAQLLARGGSDDFNLETDWAFASYSFSDQVQVRIGKIKFPTFLVSDYIEVGYSYPWIRPPQEVYTGNPITSIVGGDLLFTPRWGGLEWLIQPYYGTRNFDVVVPPTLADATTPKGSEVAVDANNLAGINFSVGTESVAVRAGYLQTDVSSSFGLGFNDEKATFTSAGLTLDWHNILSYVEFYSRDEDSALEAIFPDQEAWYATLGYRIGRFLPHATYAELREGADANPLALEQDSVTIGLRYDLTDAADLKLEIQKADPADNNFGLFDDPIEDAMLYSFALDLIF